MLISSKQVDLTLLKSRLLALLLSVVMFLSFSTNLRITGLPVGVGEIGLMLFMVCSLLFKPWQKMSSPFFLFWLAVWFCTALGYAFGNVIGNLRLHNAFAYAYTGALTLAFLTVFSRLSIVDLRRILLYFIVTSVGALWLGLFAFLRLDSSALGFLRIDTVIGRYQGWCQNANQMSLFLVPTPFLVAYLWHTARGSLWKNIGWSVLLLSSVLMGLIVRSDALGFSWILGVVALGATIFRHKQLLSGKQFVALLLIFVLGFLSVRFVSQQGWLGQPAAGSLYTHETVLEKMRIGYGETDQKVGIRLQLWENALKVWMKSPFVGHGPGAYSTFDLTETQTFTGMEAHNTLIDLMVQGGVFLALAYVGLFGWVMVTLWQTREWWLMISAMMVFSFEFFMFHLRQPLVWFFLVLILELAKIKRKTTDKNLSTSENQRWRNESAG